ncbi:SDR family NAD(P)-dependent oxidoreductase [Azohydromonas caseinilytica]|uniref:SDR family oxidoreductase n=1 Tax=Azohydromonas caseinilytica TaxID=2728836 RepID=A0A848FCT2_9BURK|nr:SDR family NAD(P)-dependent oxidoreductase [Azohydromonas caseinilytica]NML17284.1 SDR family oxidoreductase [Azohydromonas caseinilytica]
MANSSLPLAGRHALVTGAGRGIGAAIARRLADEGATLTLLGRHPEPLEALAAELPPGACAQVLVCDVADAQAVARAWQTLERRGDAVQILVNNAGQAASAPFTRTSDELWQRMLAVNLNGSFHCMRAALPGMLAAGWGRIVNVASTAGQRGYAYVAAYAAAKHGVIGLTRSLALEVAAKGITVNAVCPGFTETDLLRDSIGNVVAATGRDAGAARAEFTRHNPQGRLVQPEEVADAVAWLCTPAAGSINGQSISVSGGEVM